LPGHHHLVGLQRELGLHIPVWPDDACHVSGTLFSQPEVEYRPGNWLFLKQQTGADVDLPTHPKGVDPPIARDWYSARPKPQPEIVLRALIDQPQRLAGLRQPEQIKSAITCQVCHGEYAPRQGMVQELKSAPGIAEPDASSRRERHDQVKATIVVHVRHQQARGGNDNPMGEIGPPGDLLQTPRCALSRV
jgi:hypothetical protein